MKELSQVGGDGGDGDVSAEALQAWREECQRVSRGASRYITSRRQDAAMVRHAVWDGQSSDGRKHEEQLERKAFPFEGASDARIRLADQIVNERVLILVASALRNMPQVRGLELNGEALGKKLTAVLRWVLKNKLGSEYLRTVTKIAQYQEGDSPGVACLGVWWQQETALEMRSLTLEELRALLTEQLQVDPAAVAELEARIYDAEQDAESAEGLMQLAPHLSAKRARQCVRELRESGQCAFPAPYLKTDGPELCAYRVFEDLFLPLNARKVAQTPYFFIREWVSEVALRERVVSEEYDESWVDEVLEKGNGESAFTGEDATREGVSEGEDPELHRDEYELVTVLFRAVNDDNIPGIYYATFSVAADGTAYGRKLLEYDHGEYPLVWFSREILSERLLDSRGVPELVSTDQQALKLLTDSFADHVSLSTVPPLKAPRRRGKLGLVIGPLKVLLEDRPGEISWMQPPQYPVSNDKMQQLVKERVDEYWGRMSNTVLPTLQQLHANGIVQQFLASLSDALVQVLQLCQQYMTDEELQLITGPDGIAIGRSREEIQGKFAVELSFDPRDLDMEYLKVIADLIVKVILPADTVNVVQRDKLIQRLFMAINPTLAAETVRPIEDAQQSEVADEELNFTKIAAGIEPAMVAEGQNFPLRLQVLMGVLQKNPEAAQKLSPVSRQILEARVKYLQNQVQQIKNAQIGRQVGQPVLQG